MATNGTMMQYFHWDLPADGSLWNQVAREAGNLAAAGITALWLPPPGKGTKRLRRGLRRLRPMGSERVRPEGLGAHPVRHARGTRVGGTGSAVYIDIVFNHKDIQSGNDIACDSTERDVAVGG